MKTKFGVYIICSVLILATATIGIYFLKEEKIKREKIEHEKYIEDYMFSLEILDCIITEELIAEYPEYPEVTDIARLPDSDTIVSLYMIKEALNTYYCYNPPEDEAQKLTAQDVIDLYTTPNEEKQSELQGILGWKTNTFYKDNLKNYRNFAKTVDDIYEETYGEPYKGKEYSMYTAEEMDELVQWGIENIDYEYLASLIEKYNAGQCEQPEENYLTFLLNIGILETDDDYKLIIKNSPRS